MAIRVFLNNYKTVNSIRKLSFSTIYRVPGGPPVQHTSDASKVVKNEN